MGKTAYWSNTLLDLALNGVSESPPTVYAALFTAAAGDDPSSWTEVSTSATGYARTNISAAIAAASGEAAASDTAISWGPSSATWGGDVVAVGFFDASTSGNCLYYSYLISGSWVNVIGLDTDTWYSPGHGFSDDDEVVLETLGYGALPTGMSQGTKYYVISSTTDTFSLSASQAGAAVNVTVSGQARMAVYAPQTVTAANITVQINSGNLTFYED